MIRNGITYNKLYFNRVLYDKGYRNGVIVMQDLHPKTLAVVNYAKSNGIAVPGDVRYLDKYIRSISAIIDKMDLHYMFSGPGLSSFKLINICNPGVFNGSAFGGLAWSDSGVTGNGVDSYIVTNFNPSTLHPGQKYQLNNAGRYTVQTSGNNGSASILDGSMTSPSNCWFGSLAATQRINQTNGNLPSAADFTGTGFKGIIRPSSTGVLCINKDSQQSFLSNSTSLGNFDQSILGRQSTFSIAGVSSYAMGAALTYSETQTLRSAANEMFAELSLPQIA